MWACQVYTCRPNEPSTNLSMNWYRSATLERAGKGGELIIGMGGIYHISTSHASTAFNTAKVLWMVSFWVSFISQSVDDGYYWCQMVVNDTTCLKPSDFGHITTNHPQMITCHFQPFHFIEFKMPKFVLWSHCVQQYTSNHNRNQTVYRNNWEIMTSESSSMASPTNEIPDPSGHDNDSCTLCCNSFLFSWWWF